MFWAANEQAVDPNNNRKNWVNSRDISDYARIVGNKQERKDDNCKNWQAYNMPTSATSQMISFVGSDPSPKYTCPDNSYIFGERWPIQDFTDCKCGYGFTKDKNEDKCISTTVASSTDSQNSDASSTDSSNTDSPSTDSPNSDTSSTDSPNSDTSSTDVSCPESGITNYGYICIDGIQSRCVNGKPQKGNLPCI